MLLIWNSVADTTTRYRLDSPGIQSRWWGDFHAPVHTRQSSTQNNKYQVSQKHSCFSWWWAHSP